MSSNVNINVQLECTCDHYKGVISTIRYGLTGRDRPCRRCRRMMRRKQVVVVPTPVVQPVIQVEQAQVATHWQGQQTPAQCFVPTQQQQQPQQTQGPPPNYAQVVAAR